MRENKKRPVIAIDFDGTIAPSYQEVNDWYDGKIDLPVPILNAIPVIKLFYDLGFRLILWTCRCDDEVTPDLTIAKEYLKMWALLRYFEKFNENVDDLPFKTSNKICVDFYIDDCSYSEEEGNINWIEVLKSIYTKVKLTREKG